MVTKQQIISKLVNLLPDSEALSFEDAANRWFYNIRDEGGLRLTHEGYRVLDSILKIESWIVSINEPKKTFTKRLLLDMDRKITFPYFIADKGKKIIFFSSKEAMMAGLYGDLKSWLDSLLYRDNADSNHLS